MGSVIDYSKEIGGYIGQSLDLFRSHQLASRAIQTFRDSATISFPGIEEVEDVGIEPEVYRAIVAVSDQLRERLDCYIGTVPNHLRSHERVRPLLFDIIDLIENN